MTLTIERTSTTPFDPQKEPRRRPQRIVRQHGCGHGRNGIDVSVWRHGQDVILPEVRNQPLLAADFHHLEDTFHLLPTFGQMDRGGAMFIEQSPYLERVHRSLFAVAEIVARAHEDHGGLEVEDFDAVADLSGLDDLLSAPFVVEEVPRQEDAFDRAQSDLARLRDGWAGPGTLAPLPAVLFDLAALVTILPAHVDTPDFEVDGSDGTITLVWNTNRSSFSLVLAGNGKVVGVMSPSDGYKAWTLPIAKETQIAEKLEDDRLSSFLGI